ARADLLRLDDGEDDVRVLAVEVESDAAQFARGQSLRDLLPGLSAVGAAVEAAARAPFLRGIIVVVAVALALVSGGQQRLWIARRHAHLDDARPVIEIENLLPGFAAVAGLEEAAFLVRPIEPAERADVDDIGIPGMDGDAANLEALL